MDLKLNGNSMLRHDHFRLAGIALALLAVLGCAEKEEILEGERFGVRVPLSDSAGRVPDSDGQPEEFETGSSVSQKIVPFTLPAATRNANWTHINGDSSHTTAHPDLASSLRLKWSASAGAGNSRQARITAQPVVVGNLVFTMDSLSQVHAHTAEGGLVWTADLVPRHDSKGDASSGGLAFGEGYLFATTGYGELHAIDPATGRISWTQEFDAPANFAPTVKDGMVYVVTKDSRAWAIDTGSGRMRWSWASSGSPATVISGVSPAAADGMVYLPFPSGEVMAVSAETGVPQWQSAVGGARGAAPRSALTGISGSPVAAGGRIYAANQAGKVSAIDAATGSEVWTAFEGSYSPVWLAGGSVFLVSDAARLVRIDAATGTRIWTTPLPSYKDRRVTRRKAVYANFGPVLAGGRLIVASSDGFIRHFDPSTGVLVGTTELASGAATGPVIAGGTLYIVTNNGTLHALQ